MKWTDQHDEMLRRYIEITSGDFVNNPELVAELDRLEEDLTRACPAVRVSEISDDDIEDEIENLRGSR